MKRRPEEGKQLYVVASRDVATIGTWTEHFGVTFGLHARTDLMQTNGEAVPAGKPFIIAWQDHGDGKTRMGSNLRAMTPKSALGFAKVLTQAAHELDPDLFEDPKLVVERYEAALRACRAEAQLGKGLGWRNAIVDAVDHALREGSYKRLAPGEELGPRAKPLSASEPRPGGGERATRTSDPPPPDDIGGIEG